MIAGSSPPILVHSDWSKDPRKRWSCRAGWIDGRYCLGAPKRITPSEILAILREERVMAGFDFPIGIPATYARRVEAGPFVDWIARLGQPPYDRIFDVAVEADEISLYRPFYPQRSTGVTQLQLLQALGLSKQELFRRCEIAQGRRACPLFWTLGGNQVGRAALTGWKEVLIPAIQLGVSIWPFAGDLEDLLEHDRAIVVETYPGDSYEYVGARLPIVENADGSTAQGKRSRSSRQAAGSGMLEWARAMPLGLSTELVDQIRDGFGSDREGEDRFDSVVGLFGMIAVILGARSAGAPEHDSDVHRWEGWILGRLP